MKSTIKYLLAFVLLAGAALADKRLDELPLNPAPLDTDLVYCVQGSTDYRCTIQQIQGVAGVGADYFFTDTVSDIGGYAVMEAEAVAGAESSVPVAITAADTLIKAFATIAAEPQFTTLVKGVYNIHIHAAKTAGTKDAFVYAKFYKRAIGGTETLLFTTENSALLTGVNTEYNLHGSLIADEVLAGDDRLVVKFYGSPSGAGTNPTVTIYMEGSNASRVEIKTTSAATDVRYLTKPGLAGGQVAYGGTGTGDDLSLNSTTHATKGNINFGSLSTYYEATDSWGFGDISPLHQLAVKLRADDNVFVDGRTNPRTMTGGILRIEHTPAMAGTRAINIDINSNGHSDTNALVVDYLATNHVAGFETHALDISVDTDGSTGGAFQAVSISKIGAGTLDVAGLETYSGVSPIMQKTGAAVPIDTAFTQSGVTFTDITTNINSTGTNSQLFAADNDYLYIGKAAAFNEVHVTLAVLSSVNIQPIFQYSQGAGAWVTFGPADGTTGFQQNGNIVWSGALTGWAVDTVNGQGGRYWIRIQRTRNTVATPPTESIVTVVTTSDFNWDSSGNLSVNAVNAQGNSYFGMAGASSHPIEARKDGAGFQTIAAFENFQAAAANVGPQIMFEGASNTDMAAIQSGWNGAATTDAYIAWLTRSSNALAERMRLTSAGNLGVGTTPVNKLDVEGGAVIGATYAGANTAPTNGLLVEGRTHIGGSTDPTSFGFATMLTVTGGYPSANYPIMVINATNVVAGYGPGYGFRGSGGRIMGAINTVWDSSAVDTQNDMTFSVNSAAALTERMRLTSAGNLGIGTGAAPTDKLDVNGDTIRLRTAKTPASATDICDGGEIAWDASYIYVCTAANTWKRSALSTWP